MNKTAFNQKLQNNNHIENKY